MELIVTGFLIGIGIILAVLVFWFSGSIAALLAVVMIVGGIAWFASALIYSAYLQAPGLLIAIPLIVGIIYFLARRGAAVRERESRQGKPRK